MSARGAEDAALAARERAREGRDREGPRAQVRRRDGPSDGTPRPFRRRPPRPSRARRAGPASRSASIATVAGEVSTSQSKPPAARSRSAAVSAALRRGAQAIVGATIARAPRWSRSSDQSHAPLGRSRDEDRSRPASGERSLPCTAPRIRSAPCQRAHPRRSAAAAFGDRRSRRRRARPATRRAMATIAARRTVSPCTAAIAPERKVAVAAEPAHERPLGLEGDAAMRGDRAR